jgi:hypothetical protein
MQSNHFFLIVRLKNLPAFFSLGVGFPLGRQIVSENFLRPKYVPLLPITATLETLEKSESCLEAPRSEASPFFSKMRTPSLRFLVLIYIWMTASEFSIQKYIHVNHVSTQNKKIRYQKTTRRS